MERVNKHLKLALKRARENEDIPEYASARIEECLKICNSDGMCMDIFRKNMNRVLPLDTYAEYVRLSTTDSWYSFHFDSITTKVFETPMLQHIACELLQSGERYFAYDFCDMIYDACGLCKTKSMCVKQFVLRDCPTEMTKFFICVHCESKFGRYLQFLKTLFRDDLSGEEMFKTLKTYAQVIEELNSTPRN